MFSITAGKKKETFNVVHKDGRTGTFLLAGKEFVANGRKYAKLEAAAEACLEEPRKKVSVAELWYRLGFADFGEYTFLRYRRVDGSVDEAEIDTVKGFKGDLVFYTKLTGETRSIKIGNLLGVKTSDGWYVTE